MPSTMQKFMILLACCLSCTVHGHRVQTLTDCGEGATAEIRKPRQSKGQAHVVVSTSQAFSNFLLAHIPALAFNPSFSPGQPPTNVAAGRTADALMFMGDALKKAMGNEDFSEQDAKGRVKASHILIKGDNDVDKIAEIMMELGQRVQKEPDKLTPIFAELARRESMCSSSSKGGDLGLFPPGQMVQEFDDALFPEDISAYPQEGAVLGPILTQFGCHVILVTGRKMPTGGAK